MTPIPQRHNQTTFRTVDFRMDYNTCGGMTMNSTENTLATAPATSSPKLRKLQFSLNSLLILTAVIAVLCGMMVSAYVGVRQSLGVGPIRKTSEWPHALRELVDEQATTTPQVQVYGLGGFIDHRSIWLLRNDSPVLQRLLEKHSLIPTTAAHPKANELLESIPYGWPRPQGTEGSWQTSPEFNNQRIEGADLFLLLRNEQANVTIVLHHWNF
jgi:hypothetical protein